MIKQLQTNTLQCIFWMFLLYIGYLAPILPICFQLLNAFSAQFCPMFFFCITSFLSCCYFILDIVLGIFLLSFTSDTNSVFSLHSCNVPILFYSVIHHFIWKSAKFFFYFLLFTLCFFPSELPKYCTAAAVRLLTSAVAHPSVCHIQPERHPTCM
jgi:hypothetical protein